MTKDWLLMLVLFGALPWSYMEFDGNYVPGLLLFGSVVLLKRLWNEKGDRVIDLFYDLVPSQLLRQRRDIATRVGYSNTPVVFPEDSDSDSEFFVVSDQVNLDPIPPLTIPKTQHFMVIGSTGSGKSYCLKYILQNQPAFVLDPHHKPGSWPSSCKVYGAGRNWDEIESALDSAYRQMTQRYQERAKGKQSFPRLVIATDEMKSIVSNCDNATDILKAIAEEGRKVNIFIYVSTHSDRVKSLGIEGEGDVRNNFARFYLGEVSGEDLEKERVGELFIGGSKHRFRVPRVSFSTKVSSRTNIRPENQNIEPKFAFKVPSKDDEEAMIQFAELILERGYKNSFVPEALKINKQRGLAIARKARKRLDERVNRF